MHRVSHSVTAPAWRKEPCASADGQASCLSEKTEHVRLEIDAIRLRELLSAGVLCAADFRCLDCESRQCVWRSCLMNCIQINK